MKKYLLSLVPFLALTANAVTYMCVKTDDGQVKKYKTDEVAKVEYADLENGVSVTGQIGDFTYVDLGLESGTLWATYNVGAFAPTELGSYFAWAETEPKKNYSLETLAYYDATAKEYTKYGKDGLVVLKAADDAASFNWGSKWRMPTVQELRELHDGCDWTWSANFYNSNVSGYVGTSKKNGNIIFLPAAGVYISTSLSSKGERGLYLSASLDEESNMARGFYLNFTTSASQVLSDGRFYGHSVRAVAK